MNHHAHPAPPLPDDAAAPDLPALPEMLARLEARRSAPLRGLGEPGPTREETARLLAVAARVPDHGRLVPWRFIVLEGEARRALGRQLDALYARQNPDLALSLIHI